MGRRKGAPRPGRSMLIRLGHILCSTGACVSIMIWRTHLLTRYRSLARCSREELFGQHTRSRTSLFFHRLLVTKLRKPSSGYSQISNPGPPPRVEAARRARFLDISTTIINPICLCASVGSHINVADTGSSLTAIINDPPAFAPGRAECRVTVRDLCELCCDEDLKHETQQALRPVYAGTSQW